MPIKIMNMQQLTPAATSTIIFDMEICLKKFIGYQSEQELLNEIWLAD